MEEKDRAGHTLALAAALAMLGISVGVDLQEAMADQANAPAAEQEKLREGRLDSIQSKMGHAQGKELSGQGKMPSVQSKLPAAQNKVPAVQQKHPIKPVDPPR